MFQTHCARHRAPLIERCAVCFVEDPLLATANAASVIASCWKCGSALLSYDPDEQTSFIVAEIISLESAILALTTGRLPNRPWARLSPVPAFVEKLRILIEDLTTPTDGRVPPFLRIVDADPKWRRYLFGRQRPDTRVEEMSWYWRFLLMMTLLRQLTWTPEFQRIGAVYDLSAGRQVELVIDSGRTQAQIARELGVSEYSLTLWKKDYLRHLKPAQLDGEQMSPEQMVEKIRQ